MDRLGELAEEWGIQLAAVLILHLGRRLRRLAPVAHHTFVVEVEFIRGVPGEEEEEGVEGGEGRYGFGEDDQDGEEAVGEEEGA